MLENGLIADHYQANLANVKRIPPSYLNNSAAERGKPWSSNILIMPLQEAVNSHRDYSGRHVDFKWRYDADL